MIELEFKHYINSSNIYDAILCSGHNLHDFIIELLELSSYLTDSEIEELPEREAFKEALLAYIEALDI